MYLESDGILELIISIRTKSAKRKLTEKEEKSLINHMQRLRKLFPVTVREIFNETGSCTNKQLLERLTNGKYK